jgi:hypothetical protein
VSGRARLVPDELRDRSAAAWHDAAAEAPRRAEHEEMLLHLQRTAGNAAVARTVQRMFHNKAWQAATEREHSDDDDEPQDWGDDGDSGQEEEEKEPSLIDMFEAKVIAYRAINEKEEYDNTDPRVAGLLTFWKSSLGKTLGIRASAVGATDNRDQTIGMIMDRIEEGKYGCHHNASDSLEQIIKKLRQSE